MNKHCQARQYSDQKVCHKCGLVWDMNDPEPPACKQETQSTNSGVHNAMSEHNPDLFHKGGFATPLSSNFVEGIRTFNLLAGNTDNKFNVRQSAMYTGLQCEELSEKMEHLGFKDAADMLHNLGMAFKKGFYDARFAELNHHGRKLILDDDVDLAVVTVGSLLSQGADIHGAFAEVNRANLSKVFPDGMLHKDANGKVMKPGNWTPPDLTPFVCYD